MAIVLNTNKTCVEEAVTKLTAARKKCDCSFSEVRDGVLAALIHFCNQSELFAKRICESDKTFDGCMKYVLEKHGKCLSDIEAYRRAVCFYFENADVTFEMQIHLPEEDKSEKSAVILNLFDIL